MKKNLKALAMLLTLAVCAACLTGCAGKSSYAPSAGQPVTEPPEQSAAESAGQSMTETPEQSAAESAGQSVTEPPEQSAAESAGQSGTQQAPDEDDAGSVSEKPDVESAPIEPELSSVQGVARLAELVGNYSHPAIYEDRGKEVVVRTDDPHNPYDLTWRYGPDPDPILITPSGREREKTDSMLAKEIAEQEWDSLYREYVNACDWSLVFDADYYKKAFPMLAKLYHNDDALLLEHFQTQGVHEGRQASADFNVSEYMANCGEDLVNAFGDACECYYFYWMLNHDTERSVRTGNVNNRYPRWITLELSAQQEYEMEKVGEYREEAGVIPVTLDPEMAAFANYRAWHDAVHNVYAHDWFKKESYEDDVNDCMDRISLTRLSENTVKWYHTSFNGVFRNFALDYRYSQSHYEAMIKDDNCYAGFSNPYFSDNPNNTGDSGNELTGCCCQFDLYASTPTATPYHLN